MRSLPCSFLPSPVPAIICQPDGQLYLLYHLFLVGSLNPYDRPPFLPFFTCSCHRVPYQPVSQYHFPACKMRTHTIFSQILLIYKAHGYWWSGRGGIWVQPKLFGISHIHLIIFSFVRTFSRLVQLIAYLCTFCTSS